MKRKKDWLKARQALRVEADRALASLSPADMASQPAVAMQHELLVHKLELEMQIEELQRVHAELAEARDRYAEYYESTPVGYLTLDREGRITASNLTGAALLGVERVDLTDRRLAHFVSTRDQDRWHCLFLNMIEHPEIERLAFVLEMARPDGTAFDAYLDCRCILPPNAPPIVRVTLFDIGKIKQAEAEMQIAPVPIEGQ